jgi:hypothetical protein
MIRAQGDQLKLVDNVPPARDPPCEQQGPAQIAQVDNDAADSHDAILGLDADVIGKNVRVIPQGLGDFRRNCFIRLSARGDQDFLQGRVIAALCGGRLSDGGRPSRQNGHSQRCREE